MNLPTLIKNTRRREFYTDLDTSNSFNKYLKTDNSKKEYNTTSGTTMSSFSTMNIHLKNSTNEAFHINDRVLNYSAPDFKFDKLNKEKNANDSRLLKKSKFNWQLNEFNW